MRPKGDNRVWQLNLASSTYELAYDDTLVTTGTAPLTGVDNIISGSTASPPRYFSSQRGTSGSSSGGITYEVTGPFRT